MNEEFKEKDVRENESQVKKEAIQKEKQKVSESMKVYLGGDNSAPTRIPSRARRVSGEVRQV